MSKPTILVVDDEAFFRQLFADMLTEDDRYQVETVNSGEDALRRLDQGGIDVVITDMVMPGTCGLELLRRCRSYDSPPDVILATGNATVETAIQALKSGARDYLVKPCNPDQLRHTVHTCLEQRRLLSENSLLRTQIRLYQRGQQLASQLEVSQLFREALSAIVYEIGSGRGLAFAYTQNGIENLAYTPNLTETDARGLAGFLGPQIDQCKTTAILTSDQFAELKNPFEDLRSIWLIPLQSAQDKSGAIAICNDPGISLPDSLPTKELQFLIDQVLLGFQNACQYLDAQELIYTDDLTGLYNHRYLHVAMEQEIRRAERYGLEFSVAFIDLDLFKNINDAHGHLVGSRILREVGELLKSCMRDTDMLFRYGGDEYTALLVETDSRGANVVTDRLRGKIAEHIFKSNDGVNCRLTATIGYATYPIHATSKNDLIDLADKAMYRGKQERNTTCSANEIRPT
ncbi:MAG: diguanylate cyclase [Deltaproteobacteria bacterium]|jgi:diguanylate cyclase (GGDEF)-like protein|nr:diguanylate cyclase [Deltaproteobacteria bacterium]